MLIYKKNNRGLREVKPFGSPGFLTFSHCSCRFFLIASTSFSVTKETILGALASPLSPAIVVHVATWHIWEAWPH